MTDFDTTTPQSEATQDQAEMNERELNDVAGGLIIVVAPTAKKPAVDTF